MKMLHRLTHPLFAAAVLISLWLCLKVSRLAQRHLHGHEQRHLPDHLHTHAATSWLRWAIARNCPRGQMRPTQDLEDAEQVEGVLWRRALNRKEGKGDE